MLKHYQISQIKIIDKDYFSKLLLDVNDLISFEAKIEEFSLKYKDLVDSDNNLLFNDDFKNEEITTLGSNRLKGTLFEIFAEFFFTEHKSFPDINIVNYKPISVDVDKGVDAIGEWKTDLVAVQIKYRNMYAIDKLKPIDLRGFAAYGTRKLNCKSLILFTNLPIEKVDEFQMKELWESNEYPFKIIHRKIIHGLSESKNSPYFWKNFKTSLDEVN